MFMRAQEIKHFFHSLDAMRNDNFIEMCLAALGTVLKTQLDLLSVNLRVKKSGK